jgi:hypothetical protein
VNSFSLDNHTLIRVIDISNHQVFKFCGPFNICWLGIRKGQNRREAVTESHGSLQRQPGCLRGVGCFLCRWRILMKRANREILAVLTLLAAMLSFSEIPALASSFNLTAPNAELSGFPGPYATVSINLTDATHATIAITSLSGYLMGHQGAFDGNVNANTFTVSTIVATLNGTSFSGFFDEKNKDGLHEYQNIDARGSYNLVITNNGSDLVNFMSFTLTNTSGTWSSDTDVFRLNSINPLYLAASHISVTGPNGVVTGYVSGVPIPGAAYLMGSGLMALLGLGFRRKRSS